MTEQENKLLRAMTMTEVTVQDMAESGLTPQDIAIGLAFHLKKQVDLAMPTEATRKIWMMSFLGIA